MTRGSMVAWAAAIALAVAVAGWVVVQRRSAARAERDAGAALFHGTQPMTGRLNGHDEPLPTLATRCSNCHEAISTAPRVVAESPASAPSGSASVERPASGVYARRLGGDWLTQSRSRHGGPPSTYDALTFCTLLRTGVDPVSVMIPSAMPRYAASDGQCRALWAYLVSLQ